MKICDELLTGLTDDYLQHLDCWFGVFVAEIFCYIFLLHSDIWRKPKLLCWIILQGDYKLFSVFEQTPNLVTRWRFLLIATVTSWLFWCHKTIMLRVNWCNNFSQSKLMFWRCCENQMAVFSDSLSLALCTLMFVYWTNWRYKLFFQSGWNMGLTCIGIRISSKRTFGIWLGDSLMLREKWPCFCL